MKRTHTYPVLLLAVMLVWILPACNSPVEDTAVDDDLITREQVVDFDDEYGGFNFGDEAPAFNDPYLTENYAPEVYAEYDDPIERDPAVSELIKCERPRTYLLITWGNLEADTTIDFPTDWSGSLSAENGVIRLKRTIRFDPEDEILPRVSRDLLEWKSWTQPHFDGILVALHKVIKADTLREPSSLDANDVEPMSITFDTPPLTVTISEEDLKDLHRVVKVDEAGNAVAFNTITVIPNLCRSGFLAGQWRPVPHRPGGIFRGKWVSHDGAHMGYLRGVYGVTSSGDRMFFGKWINRFGKFRGLLVGKYGSFDAEPGGWFEGVWIGRNLNIEGRLGGVWNTDNDITADNAAGGGFFRGRWAENCPTISPR
jgi:hypothetical protein